MKQLIAMLTITGLLGGCSYIPNLDKVLPDNRTDYQKSEPLPDLEVPPDLTAGASTEDMTIPGEGASLARYKQRRNGQSGASPAASGTGSADDQWVSIAGSKAEIWPRLKTFFQEQGYVLELEDMELGVMETAWSEPVSEGGATYRDKFKVFTEPGADAGVTVLFISNERQRRSGEGESAAWIEQGSSDDAEKMLAGDLNLFFNDSRNVAGASSSAGSSTSAMAERKLAELQDAGDDRLLLALPEAFTRAWQNTGMALERAGFSIDEENQSEGVYHITYYDRSADREEGWLSKLAFWQDDEPEGIPYVLSLTGNGNRTELKLLNENGDWQAGKEAGDILRIIRNEYNRL